MSFIRSFDTTKMNRLSNESKDLFTRLSADVFSGIVFPAVRKEEIHFYYKGGCLYRFNGLSFKRDTAYQRYNDNTEGLDEYEKAKKQNENKFINSSGMAKERQLLNRLNRHTFNTVRKTKVVVLDIETRLNGKVGGNKKCDIVLLNTSTNEIMFVEGKVFSDCRVNRIRGSIPEVIEQVHTYTAAIAEQRHTIIEEYGKHIRIINELFGTVYNPQNTLIDDAKLLVYETPKTLTDNNRYSIETINEGLGRGNVVWYQTGEKPSIDQIWDALSKG